MMIWGSLAYDSGLRGTIDHQDRELSALEQNFTDIRIMDLTVFYNFLCHFNILLYILL